MTRRHDKEGRLSRRHFLAGASAVGAAALTGLPFRSARAQEQMPRRFVFVLSGNGFDASVMMSPKTRDWLGHVRGKPVEDSHWWGTKENRDYGGHDGTHIIQDALSGAPGLRALEQHGLMDKAAVVYGLHSMIVGGGHSAAHGILSSTRALGRQPVAETLDNFLSHLPTVRGVGEKSTPLPAIRLGIHRSASISYGCAAAGRRKALPVLHDPQATWDAYVRPFVDADGLTQLDRRQRLIELAKKDAERALRAGAPESLTSQHIAACEAVLGESELFREIINDRNGTLIAPPQAPTGALADAPLDRLDYQMKVAATALEAGLTNVMLVGIGTGGGFDFNYNIGNATENRRHELCHVFSGDESANVRQELREVWSREIDAVAGLAAHLDAIPEGAGTMLDHTMIVYLADNGVGHHASAIEFPLLVMGGSALGLKTQGRALIYPGYEAEQASRMQISHLWNTTAEQFSGDEMAEFAPAVAQASGILPELLLDV